MSCTQSVLPLRVGWRCARSGWRCRWDSQAACLLCARWRWGCGCHLQSGRGAMSCRACSVLSRGVASCDVTSRRVASCHVMSCHVMSRHVTSRHVMPCYVVSRRVLSRCVVSRREKRPQHIDTATSLSHYAKEKAHTDTAHIPLAFAQLTLTPLTLMRPRSSVYQP